MQRDYGTGVPGINGQVRSKKALERPIVRQAAELPVLAHARAMPAAVIASWHANEQEAVDCFTPARKEPCLPRIFRSAAGFRSEPRGQKTCATRRASRHILVESRHGLQCLARR